MSEAPPHHHTAQNSDGDRQHADERPFINEREHHAPRGHAQKMKRLELTSALPEVLKGGQKKPHNSERKDDPPNTTGDLKCSIKQGKHKRSKLSVISHDAPNPYDLLKAYTDGLY